MGSVSGLVLSILLAPALAYAHVKWFSKFTYADRPRSLAEIATPTFLALAVLSTVVIGGLAFADEWLRSTSLAKRIDAWLETYRGESMVVLRVGAGATMLMAWQAGTLLAPELPAVHDALGWAQFGVVLLLLIPQTVPLAGVLLDYAFYPGIAFALAVSRSAQLLTVLLVAYQAGAQHKYEAAIRGELGPADRARPVDSPPHDHGDHPHEH